MVLARLILVLLLCAGVAPVTAQSPDPAAIDKIFAQYDRRDSPGCAVSVFKDGRILYERGYGMADLEHDVPIGPETVFYVGSVSKQFTAMAAALAIQQGKLSPDDPVRKHLPELPDYAAPISVRHLIHHTSGLRDYNTLLSIAGRRGDEAYDNPTVLRMTVRQKGLNFPPGDEYLYSNTGYTLLATIVERATGTPFADFADRHIFKPLGMTVTHFHTDSGRLVKNRAHAYAARSGDEVRLDTPSNERAGAGGVYTNIRDLQRWDENFYTGRVGGEALLEQIQTVGMLNGGRRLTYAWGLMIGAYRGQRIVEHSGSLGGYRAHTLRFPAAHTSAVALCNQAGITPSGLLRQVADIVLAKTFTEPSRPRERNADQPDAPRPDEAPAAAVGEQLPAGVTGDYYSDEIDATFTVTESGDRLMLQREADASATPLQRLRDGRFRVRNMTLRFAAGADGRVSAIVVDAGRVRDIRFTRRNH